MISYISWLKVLISRQLKQLNMILTLVLDSSYMINTDYSVLSVLVTATVLLILTEFKLILGLRESNVFD